MKKTNLTKIAISTMSVMALSLALSACGGGGGGSSNNGSGSGSNNNGNGTGTPTNTNTSPITMFPAVSSSLQTYTPVGDIATDSLGWLNAVRQTVGLRVLPQNSAVAQASQNHANYLVANDLAGHYETAGTTGYTGVDPLSRITAVYNTTTVGEVVVTWSGSFSDTLGPVKTLFDAPFHRIVMLTDFGVAGASYTTGTLPSSTTPYSAMNIDFADYVQTLPSSSLVSYPYNGELNTPTGWVANESPNPFNNVTQYIGQTVGYPVTVQGALTDTLDITSFTITSAAGASVPCLAIDHNTANIGSELNGAAMCVPYTPLNANTQYTANVVGSKNGQAFTVSFNWTTGVTANTSAAVARSLTAGGASAAQSSYSPLNVVEPTLNYGKDGGLFVKSVK